MHKKFLTPIVINEPPAHTNISPRCFTCKKFDTCFLRDDYLKTATLIQNIIGNPQQDELLIDYKDYTPPALYGQDFLNPSTIFPQTLILLDSTELTYEESKWQTLDLAQVLYSSPDYKIVFPIMWDHETRTYKIIDGFDREKEVKFEISDEDKKEICFNLKTWRQEIKDQIQEGRKDIINTTYFTPRLECFYYEHIKGMSEQQGIERIIRRFPKGVPCKDGSFYHLATFHIEQNQVPMYHPENGEVILFPAPYPVFIPKPVKENFPPPKRRGDL